MTTYVRFKKLNEEAVIPSKAHASDSGFDLVASKDVLITPGETLIIPTGIAVHLPEGYEAQVRPRSGVTFNTKLRVALGTIDNGYRGEVGVIVDNIVCDPFDHVTAFVDLVDGSTQRTSTYRPDGTYLIRKGDRIAQLVVQELPKVVSFEMQDSPDDITARGANGFGSSGV